MQMGSSSAVLLFLLLRATVACQMISCGGRDEGRTAMANEFEYNRDLFLTPEQQEALKKEYPLIWFALGQPNSEFSSVDDAAKREKRNFRYFGYAAVGLGTLALILASVEPTLIAPAVEAQRLHEGVATGVAIFAALAGLGGVIIGWAGMGTAGRKRLWLQSRLLAERMRQWQWQHFVGTLETLATATRDEKTRQAYVTQRASDFRAFHAGYKAQIGARLNQILGQGQTAMGKIWIEPTWPASTKDATAILEAMPEALREEILRAYRNARFKGQIDYVVYQLGAGKFATHPVTQLKILHGLGRIIVAAIIALHVAVIVGVFWHIEELKSPELYVFTLSLALCALALRVIEDGFRPVEQIARLKSYLGVLESALEKFDAPGATVADKVAAMHALEEGAALEMVEFVEAADKARFVM